MQQAEGSCSKTGGQLGKGEQARVGVGMRGGEGRRGGGQVEEACIGAWNGVVLPPGNRSRREGEEQQLVVELRVGFATIKSSCVRESQLH